MEPAKRERRTREQIILGILDQLHEGDRSKTNIVYGRNLNFQAANRYIEYLVEKSLIVYNEHTGHWQITAAGEDCRKVLRKSLRAIEAVL